MKRFWLENEVKTLRSMLKEKCTVSEIGDALGRTRDSVEQKMIRLRIGNGRTGKPKDIIRIAFIID